MLSKLKWILALGILTFFILYYSNGIRTIIPSKDYRFEISPNPLNIQFDAIHLYYDFDSQKGVIQFVVRPENNLTGISIDIPNDLSYGEINAYKFEENLTDKYDKYEVEGFLDSKRLILSNFNVSVNYVKFLIHLEKTNTIYPNGKFFFISRADSTYGKSEKTDSQGTERVRFKLGKYICNQPCYYDFVSSVEGPLNNEIVVHSIKEENNEITRSEEGNLVSFQLSAYDGNKETERNFWQAVGTGFIVSITFLIIDMLWNRKQI